MISEPPAMYTTYNIFPIEQRQKLNLLMNLRLASAIDLKLQMKQAHWNVKGNCFIGLHELFDKINQAVEGHVDMIAERIVQLGGVAEGTIRTAAERTQLDEYPSAIVGGMAHVDAAARALSAFGREVRTTIEEAGELNDPETADMFTEICRSIDKWLWFVEAHIQTTL